MNLIIDEDEVRILNQVNYNADSFWRQYDSYFENCIEIDYHTFTLKKWHFLSKFEIILRPDFNILEIRSLPLGRGDKGWYPAGIRT